MGDLVNLYASNGAELLLKSFFVADAKVDMYEDPAGACGISRATPLDLADYAAVAWGADVKSRYLRLDIEAENVPADSIRLELGSTKWFHEGLKARLADGTPVANGDTLNGDVTLIFDLLENEFTLDGTADLTVHAGGGFTGTLTVTNVKLLADGWTGGFYIADSGTAALTPAGGYVYGGWVYVPHGGATALRMKIAGDGETTFGSFRVANADVDFAEAAINTGKLIATRDDGSVVAANDVLPTEGEFVTLTLADGGAFPEGFHAHYGDESMNGHTLTLSNFTAIYEHMPYAVVVNSYSDVL